MKSISFKNFRRFTDFPEFKFGEITILVGGNNAGKSTLIKAINLLVSNLKAIKSEPVHSCGLGSASTYVIKMPKFDLQTIGLYSQVHNVHNSEPIEFSICFGDCGLKNTTHRFELIFNLSTANDNSKELDINRIRLNDRELALDYIINRNGDECEFEINWLDFEEQTCGSIKNIDSFIYESKKKIESAHNCEEHVRESYLDQLIEEGISDSLTRAEYVRAQRIVEASKNNQKHSLKIAKYNILPEYLDSNLGLARLFESFTLLCYDNRISEDGIGTFKSLDFLKYRIKDSVMEFQKSISSLSLIATPYYPIERAKNYVKGLNLSFSLIDRFYKVDDTKKEFFKKSLEFFEIAKDFKICAIDDIAYNIDVLDLDGQWINMQELGTGSLRLIIMFMHVLTSHDKFLYIEEPEQNLHPALQSKLADFLFDINREFGMKFIVETHSEYLLREVQILVAKNHLASSNNNPFQVYYFHKETGPYDMGFQNNGKFIESFGPGFFDVADNAALELFDYDEE